MDDVPRKSEQRTRVDGERTRRHILDTAVRLATVRGLDGLSIGTLAHATTLSKGGVYAHFDSKEQLQLATVDKARALFIDAVVAPAMGYRGLERLRELCESFLAYVENRTLPGGCFFAAAAAELGARPGPLRERVAANQKDWMAVLADAASEAVTRGELLPDTDVGTLVFELNALVIAANTAFILHDEPAVLDRARGAIERVVLAASPRDSCPLGAKVEALTPETNVSSNGDQKSTYGDPFKGPNGQRHWGD